MKRPWHYAAEWVAMILLALVMAGCSMLKPRIAPPDIQSRPAAQVRAQPRVPVHNPSHLVHHVQWPGETLSIISKWYTGSYLNWKTIVAATPGRSDARIAVGDEVWIPDRLLKTRSRMPHSFVDRHRNLSEASHPRAASPPSESNGAIDADSESAPSDDPSDPYPIEEESSPVPFGPKSYP
ncbi:MAG: hypothetical protein ACOWWM_08930 [Desulfobacterales bacterium]